MPPERGHRSPRARGGSRSARRSPGTEVLPGGIAAEIRETARGHADRALAALEQAVTLVERGRPGAAVRAAEEAKALAPRSGAVREVLGMALYGAERYREALRELQAYRRMTGRVDQNHLIADCHRALGAPERAVQEALDAIRAGVTGEARAEATVVAASALADLGRVEEALGMLRAHPARPGVVRPFDLRVWYVTGDILARAGRTREAREEFRRIVAEDPQAFDAAERLAGP